jgi:sugar O-acyltransferase (sialic acid O-acetyltransferase NeuD family)
MNRVAIIGAGMLGRQVAHHIQSDQGYQPAGFFDDYAKDAGGDGPLLGKVDDVDRLFAAGAFDQLIVGIGYMHFAYRWQCFERFRGRVPFLTFVHSSSWVDRSARVGAGSFLMPGVVVDDHVAIGENVFVQLGAAVSHHSTVGENCFLGPSAKIAGCVSVGRDCFLGVGSVVSDSVTLCPGVRTGAGAVVAASIEEAGLYVGVPARKVR